MGVIDITADRDRLEQPIVALAVIVRALFNIAGSSPAVRLKKK